MVDVDSPEEPRDEGISRRAFVKGCVLATAGVATAAAVGSVVNSSFITQNVPARRVHYIGSTLVSGPAPQGIPLIPLREVDGVVVGNPEFKRDDEGWREDVYKQDGTVLDWYRYCGHEETPGLLPDYDDADENVLRYFLLPEKLASTKAAGIDLWYRDLIDAKEKENSRAVAPGDFREVGLGAGFYWRSHKQFQKNIITGIVMRLNKKAFRFDANSWPRPDRFQQDAEEMMIDLGDGTVLAAFVSFCKHFCCVPGWQESRLARTQGFWGRMFCTCHFSVYNPVQIKGDYFSLAVESRSAP